MKKVVRITPENLGKLFKENSDEIINGSTPVTVSYATTPKLRGGKSNPLNGMIKITTVKRAMLFQYKSVNAYESMVKRRMEQEGLNPDSFTVKPRTWGERIKGTPIIAHTDKKGVYKEYLDVIPTENSIHESVYIFNGKVVDEKDAKEQIYVAPSKAGAQGGLKEAGRGVQPITPYLNNLHEITVNKTTYRLM